MKRSTLVKSTLSMCVSFLLVLLVLTLASTAATPAKRLIFASAGFPESNRHSHSLMLREEAIATLTGFWRSVEELKVVDDYQAAFRMKRPAATMPYAASRAADLRIVSKAQWDQEGFEGFDKRPAGTGSYRYVGRQLGQSITYERVEKFHLMVMKRVGLAVAVHNATPEVRRAAHFTTKADGGKGAARELVEVILKSKGIWEEMIDKARA